MSGRPFQVGDPVKITDYDVMTGKTVRVHTGTIRSLRDMSSSDASDWVTLIADVDEPYLMGKTDTLHTVAIVHLTPDRTRSTWAANQTVVLRTADDDAGNPDAWVSTTAPQDAPEQDDDGTEAESLAEVSVPAFPDVLVHGRASAA
jgi:hypothetical protein